MLNLKSLLPYALRLMPFGALCLMPLLGITQQDLFSADEPLRVFIEADFDKILDDRSQDSKYQACRLYYLDGNSDTVKVIGKIKTRGRFRLRKTTCEFPPIKLNLKKRSCMGTLFHGNDNLKLVTHCNDRKRYTEYVFEEYLIYKSYNLLTDTSFKVRLAHLSYINTANTEDTLTQYGFFIQDIEEIAEDLEGKEYNAAHVQYYQVNKHLTDMISVFQFMIANTDWSLSEGHNIKFVLPGMYSKPIPIPYDFDWSGIIHTDYAKPNPVLGIEDVRHRLFRGYCTNKEDYKAVFSYFNEKKSEIYGLYDDFELLDTKAKKKIRRFQDNFYEIINDPKKAEREIFEKCRK